MKYVVSVIKIKGHDADHGHDLDKGYAIIIIIIMIMMIIKILYLKRITYLNESQSKVWSSITKVPMSLIIEQV